MNCFLGALQWRRTDRFRVDYALQLPQLTIIQLTLMHLFDCNQFMMHGNAFWRSTQQIDQFSCERKIYNNLIRMLCNALCMRFPFSCLFRVIIRIEVFVNYEQNFRDQISHSGSKC